MSAEPETLATILAEMRASSLSTVRAWADRIDAAAEREREKAKGLSKKLDGNRAITGNAVAMREALKEFLDLARRGLAFCTSYRYTEAENEEIETAFDAAKTALAAPARNCDRFATAAVASAAFRREHPDEASSDFAVNLIYWLFATAKGGDHA